MTVAPAQPVSKGLGSCPTSASKIPGLTIEVNLGIFCNVAIHLHCLLIFRNAENP